MLKGRDILIILLVVACIGFLLWNMLLRKPTVNWHEKYEPEKFQPYDIGIFFSLLDSSTTEPVSYSHQRISHSLGNLNDTTWMFIAHTFFIDTLSADTLISFVERGNYAFLSQKSMPENLFYTMEKRGYGYLSLYSVDAWKVWLNFYEGQPRLEEEVDFTFYSDIRTEMPYWAYLEPSANDTGSIEQLGYFLTGDTSGRYCNFYSVKMGKGRLYMHMSPLLFTNYALSEKDGFMYARKVMSHLPDKPVLIDQFHHRDYPTDEEEDYSNQGLPETPLKYIFSQPALTYAWYTLMGSFLLFLLFRSKRQQRIIPLIPEVENSSIAFAKSLGALYHRSKNPKFIVYEMMKIFDNFNRRRYNLDRKEKDTEAARKIAKRSRVEESLVEEILMKERQIIYHPNPSMKEIIPLYQLLEKYYQKAKS